MSIIDNPSPVDFHSSTYRRLFDALQANIVKGHGRDFTANMFVRFEVDGARLKDILRDLASRFVTSAYDQLVETEAYNAATRAGIATFSDSLIGNLLLTKRTYEKLGLGNCLEDWFNDPRDPEQGSPRLAHFLGGMLAAAPDLRDELRPEDAVEPLERAYVDESIDALLLLASDNGARLHDVVEALDAEFTTAGTATVLAVEYGEVLCDDQERPIEHFGYVDGISQPLFLRSDFDPPRHSTERWNPFAKLSLVLLPDPGTDAPDAFGSYYVFRKLEQNVPGFIAAERELASRLGLRGSDQARAGAMIIGRFRDGTPLTLSSTPGSAAEQVNDFRYDGLRADLRPGPAGEGDRVGLKCPFPAHIRKANPRQSQNALSSPIGDIEQQEARDRAHRIVRRGITYGARVGHQNGDLRSEDRPSGGVGLLFACFQRSIMRQFAFIQKKWSNTSIFKIPGDGETTATGLDPIIGQPHNDQQPAHRWRQEYGGSVEEPEVLDDLSLESSHETRMRVGGFVKFRGGEFFFAPSLPFLRGQWRE